MSLSWVSLLWTSWCVDVGVVVGVAAVDVAVVVVVVEVCDELAVTC